MSKNVPPFPLLGDSPEESLRLLTQDFPGQVVFSTSFGKEDQVITDLIARGGFPVEFFTLDTGRLFQETYSTWAATLSTYSLHIKTYAPEASLLEKILLEKGPNSFYESVENRKECCHIRKVEPLKRALQGKKIWITGIRAAQSPDRQFDSALEWDPVHEVFKYHPLLTWSQEEVDEYIRQYQVPVNPLHQKGFVSIGCLPCTRAIRPGEDFRAGRWWWEDNTAKECGLHVHAPSSETQTTPSNT